MSAATTLASDYPLLWEKAEQFDFAERLGGCTDPLMAEIDKAMHELWLARTNRAEELDAETLKASRAWLEERTR